MTASFDHSVGHLFRRAEAREEGTPLRDTRAINDKVRLLVRLGGLITVRQEDADLRGAIADAVGWGRLAASVAEDAEGLFWWGACADRRGPRSAQH